MSIAFVALVTFFINIPLGCWRNKYKKFTLPWWLLIHASIPFVITLRVWLDTPHFFIPLFIGLAIAGQLVGAKVLSRPKQEQEFD